MNSLLDQVFGVRSLTFGGADVEFRFARELPLWAWVGVLAACLLLAGWSYWKLLGSRGWRGVLAVLRAGVLALIAFLIAGPELVKQNERIERDWVVVMADRSASMGVADVAGEAGTPGKPATRETQLRAAMRRGAETFTRLSEQRNVLYMGFDSGAFDLRVSPAERGAPAAIDLGEPAGRRTFIGQSLEQALRRVAARPVAGVVLLTDGRSADTPGRSVLRQLESAKIPVFPVPLGSEKALPDLAVTRVEAPSAAFVGDMVPVGVRIERLGAAEGAPPAEGTIQLIDTATGLVLDERPLRSATAEPGSPDENERHVTLLAKPADAGPASWAVRIVTGEPDLTADNNSAPVRLQVADRPIRVVYFDGYPRWEYRYVKNIMVRERSMKVSALLLASDRRYIQDGNEILDAIPRTQPGWNAFDVIVLGDLRPELFSTEQLTQIRDLVAERGAGLLWIGGSGSTPGAWRGTPLADLLPFSMTAESGMERGPQAWLSPVLIKPGAAAERYGVLQLSGDADKPWPPPLLDAALGWPLVRWAQKIEPSSLKPTAEVLALAEPADGADTAAPGPLVLTMRYGAGRTIYVGTDETWRYRYAAGEVLTERFWIPLVRLLARESLGRSGKPALLTASPETVQAQQQVQIAVRLLDQALIDQRPASITVRIAREGEPADGVRPAEVRLLPRGVSDDAPAANFAGVWMGVDPGFFTVTSNDPVLSGLDLSARVEVVLPDDELRFPQTDHAALTTLAQQTGGSVLTADRLSELPTLLPNRQLRVLGTPDVETLWDKPVIWALLLTLLAAEWIGRRLIKLA